MEFIDYDDIEAVKAGVQEAGMIMGGDYLFKFYLVIFLPKMIELYDWIRIYFLTDNTS